MHQEKRRLKNFLLAGSLLALVVGASGCVAHAYGGVDATYAEPDLVEIQPGVFVVENHGTAVFFSNGYYWRQNGGIWYRSGYYDNGFVRVSHVGVPIHVRGIRRPNAYVRYRSHARAKRIRARTHRQNVRTHRTNQRTHNRAGRVDHRRDQRNVRRDHRAQRRDNRAQRRDVRHDRRDNRRKAKKQKKKSSTWGRGNDNRDRKKRRR